MEKDYLSITRVVKNLQNEWKIKTQGKCSNSSQFVFCCNPYTQANFLNYSTFSSL